MDVDITNGPYRGNIYFTVPDGVEDGPYYHSDILFMKSTDGGASWTPPIRVNDDPLGKEVFQFHQWITVNQKGAIIILFYDQRNDPPNYRKFDTYIAFSFDGGETFTTNYRVSDVSSDPALALPEEKGKDYTKPTNQPFMPTLKPVISKAGLLGEYIGVVAYQDQVHCVWTDTRDGNQNVYYSNFGIPLLPPRLFLPEDESYQLTFFPTFKWSACGYFDEITYDLQISTDSTFATIDFEYADIDTNIFTMPDSLPRCNVYYWRVKAFDEVGHESDWPERSFRFSVFHCVRGDVNADGVINVTDVVYLINYLFLVPPGPAPVPLEAGDVNCDGEINVTDVVYLINFLFLVPPGPPPGC
jgi:hypothetical protein